MWCIEELLVEHVKHAVYLLSLNSHDKVSGIDRPINIYSWILFQEFENTKRKRSYSSICKCKIQKNWCTVNVAPTIEYHGGHSQTPASQRWDQVPGRSQRLLLGLEAKSLAQLLFLGISLNTTFPPGMRDNYLILQTHSKCDHSHNMKKNVQRRQDPPDL